jgi:hypothetical protein
VVGHVPWQLRQLPFQPFVEDERASGPIGWNSQPFPEDERSSRPFGWKFQSFIADERSSGANGWIAGGRPWRAPSRALPPVQ